MEDSGHRHDAPTPANEERRRQDALEPEHGLADGGLRHVEPRRGRAEAAAVRDRHEGLELAGVLRLLADWGSRGSAHAEPMRHAACGTPMEAKLWCPTCARSVDEPEADGLRFV